MDITQYIQQRRSLGVGDMQIRQELMANGWSSLQLDQAFAAVGAGAAAELPSPVSPSFATTQPSRQPRTKRVTLAVSIIVIMLALAAAAVLVLPRVTRKASKASDTLARPALQANQAATARRADMLSLAGKLSDYMTTHGNAMPGTIRVKDTHTLLLCDATCDAGSPTEASLGFDVSGVELHPYAANLHVPNGQAVYVVPGASCDGTNTGVRQSNTPGYAVLYSTSAADAAVKQGCINS